MTAPNIHLKSNEVISKVVATGALTNAKNAPGVALRTSAYRAYPDSITRRADWNPRFDFGEIDGLEKSIRANGILNPLRVKRIAGAKPGDRRQFELIDGDRRLTAIEQAIKHGHEFADGVPVIIVDKGQDEMTSLIQMFEANSGKVFLPLEEAAAYGRMREAGMTIQDICKNVSRKQVHVVATLALLIADDSVTEAVKDGSVNGTTAKKIAVAARGNKVKQAELIAAAKSAGKDKSKKAVVSRAIDDARRAKAAKKGKILKMRALGDDELSALGAGLALLLTKKLTEAGKDLDFDVRSWVSKGDDLALAFTFGALEALKAAAGATIKLDI